jgi:hypothetical protein
MTVVLDYENLTADFNQKLVTQLRGHSADNEYLETWVPDEDPVKSILNMVEAALSSGLETVRVRIASSTLNETQRDALLAELGTIAEARLVDEGSDYELVIDGAKS